MISATLPHVRNFKLNIDCCFLLNEMCVTVRNKDLRLSIFFIYSLNLTFSTS